MGRAALAARWIAVFSLAGVATSPAGCTRRNDAYCCTDPALCADVGGVVQQCPSGQLCDDTGGADRPAHSCYPDPNAQDCRGPDDCGDDTPACVGGICVQCDADAQCATPAAPRCDLDLYRCGDCEGPEDCARFGDAMTCDVDTGACVECVAEDPPRQSAACGAATPVCGAGGTCRACDDHRECDSGACDLDTGACVDAAQVAYVQVDADDGNTACTDTAPCNSVTRGLAAMRPYVVVGPGTYMENVAVAGRTVTLIGYGATIQAAQVMDGIAITGNTGAVAIYGLAVSRSVPGISCSAASTATTSLTLVDVTVEDNFDEGVTVTSCDLTVTRSRVSDNPGGGIEVREALFDITSSIVDGNGDAGLWGGIRIDLPRLGANRLAFNTIVANESGASGAPGVACASSSSLPVFHSNIITGNTGATGNVQVSANNCSYEQNLINPQLGSNPTGDPAFTVAYRIAPDSPARGAGRAGGDAMPDIDGDPRDDAPDIGADEYVPTP